MRPILDHLFYQHDRKREQDKAALQCIATNTGMLEKECNQWQKDRLLDIIDGKDALACQRANDSFTSGVRYGVLFMMEVFSETIADRDN